MKKAICRYAVPALGLTMACLLLFSCSGKAKKPSGTPDSPGTIIEGQAAGAGHPAGTRTVAEQIVYDVEIINPYPDDTWTAECLRGLDHRSLVDFVFDGLYAGRFSAFDIFEGTPIPARKIKKMEEKGEFSRDGIGKFQFQEEWILDTVRMTYTKKVTEIRMGLQKFNDDGELTGYAPLLRVVL